MLIEGGINVKKITILDLDSVPQSWLAVYAVNETQNVRCISIESRSAIEVVVAKVVQTDLLGTQVHYYISSPNYGIAIPDVTSLSETYWITEQLINHNMPTPDAVTVAQVLDDLGDF